MSINSKKSFTALLAVAFLFAPFAPLQAANIYDKKPAVNDQVWYDTREYSNGCTAGGEISSSDLPKATVKRINALKDTYVKVANETKVPWQLLAAIDYRESGNSPSHSMLAGEPLGSVNPDHPEVIVKSKEESIRKAVEDYLKPLAKSVYNVTLTTSLSPEDIMQAAVAYNRGSIYKTRNIAVADSPYAMNNYDDEHMKMFWPPQDPVTVNHGKTQDANDGVLTVYVKLGGATGSDDSVESCGADEDQSSVSADGNKIVEVALAELKKGVRESPDGCNCGGRINVYTDNHHEFWCADFVSWVYKEAGSAFTGGSSGGWRLPAVVSLVAWFKKHGTWVDNGSGAPDPQKGDVIWFNYGRSNGDTGSGNHTGIIVDIRGTTLVTIEGNSSNGVRQRTYTQFRKNGSIQGWGRKK